MNDDTKPHSWQNVPLADIGQINPKKTDIDSSDSESFNFVPMPAVAKEFGGIDVSELRPYESIKKGYTQFKENDVLFAKITPCMENGKIAVVPKLNHNVAYGSTEFHVVRSFSGIESKWIARYLSQISFRKDAQRNMQGAAGQLRVPKKWLSEQLLPLAPSPEQQRIVSKIEELFSRLDAGVAALEKVKANLKRYRSSVLKAAVEGKLAEQWRRDNPPRETSEQLLERILVERRCKWEENTIAEYERKGKKPPNNWRDKYKEPEPPDISKLPELPEGWCWASLSQVGFLDRGKSKHRPRNDPILFDGPYPFIQTGVVRHSGTFITDYTQTYSEQGLAQSKLWPRGTLCITIAANIADTAILDFECCFPDSVVGFTPASSEVLVRFVELYLRTMKSNIEAVAPATAQKNINLDILQQVAICVPSYKEQVEIINMADAALSNSLKADTDINNDQKLAIRLRQAILKKAFEGKLVPQNPDDEPAEKLLARIKAERETSSQNASRRSGKRAFSRRKG